MRRLYAQRAAAWMTGLTVALTASSALAAIWTWACRGELAGQRILFDRDGLYIAPGKAPAGRSRTFTKQSIEDDIAAVKTAGNFTTFGPEDSNDTMFAFSLTGDDKQKQKIVLTERSSRRIAHHHRLVQCGSRDEDTDLYLKIYRYERDGEPAHDITMQCLEYQLSTKGGRKGCDFGD